MIHSFFCYLMCLYSVFYFLVCFYHVSMRVYQFLVLLRVGFEQLPSVLLLRVDPFSVSCRCCYNMCLVCIYSWCRIVISCFLLGSIMCYRFLCGYQFLCLLVRSAISLCVSISFYDVLVCSDYVIVLSCVFLLCVQCVSTMFDYVYVLLVFLLVSTMFFYVSMMFLF